MVQLCPPPIEIPQVPLTHHEALADEMREERVPEEFIGTIPTGWCTTCLEVLPGKERANGRFCFEGQS